MSAALAGRADAGLQVERTTLAWRRTALSGVGLGLLLVRLGVGLDQPWEIAVGAGVLLTVGSLAGTGRVRRPGRPRGALIGAVSVALATVSALALCLVLLGH